MARNTPVADLFADNRAVKRFVVAVASIVVAVTVSACGGVPTSSPVTTAWNKADGRLVRRLLAEQVPAVRSGLRAHIRGRTETQFTVRCAASASALLNLTADASSPDIYDNYSQLRVEDYLYSDAPAAKRALRGLGSKGTAACFEQFAAASVQKSHRSGTAELKALKSVHAGTEARAAEIMVPFTYKGRVARGYLDYVFAREGRAIVEVISTEDAELRFDVSLAQWLTQLAATKRAARSDRPI